MQEIYSASSINNTVATVGSNICISNDFGWTVNSYEEKRITPTINQVGIGIEGTFRALSGPGQLFHTINLAVENHLMNRSYISYAVRSNSSNNMGPRTVIDIVNLVEHWRMRRYSPSPFLFMKSMELLQTISFSNGEDEWCLFQEPNQKLLYRALWSTYRTGFRLFYSYGDSFPFGDHLLCLGYSVLLPTEVRILVLDTRTDSVRVFSVLPEQSIDTLQWKQFLTDVLSEGSKVFN